MAQFAAFPIKVPLSTPIFYAGETLTEIELIEPDGEMIDELAAQMLAGAELGIGRACLIVCAYARLPPSVIWQLRSPDIERVGAVLAEMIRDPSRVIH